MPAAGSQSWRQVTEVVLGKRRVDQVSGQEHLGPKGAFGPWVRAEVGKAWSKGDSWVPSAGDPGTHIWGLPSSICIQGTHMLGLKGITQEWRIRNVLRRLTLLKN